MELKCPSCDFSVDRDMKACPNCGADLRGKNDKRLKKSMAILVVFLLLTTSIFIYFITQKVEEVYRPKGIEIDGDFEDWRNIASISDEIESFMFNQNTNILDYRIDGKLGELSFYLEVNGEMLAGEPEGDRHVDYAYFFIDSDQDPSTGFLINSIGSDFMIEVYGCGSEVLEAGLYSYTSSDHDWDLWEHEGSADVKVSGSAMEVQVYYKKLNLGSQDAVDALYYTRSWNGFDDFGDIVVSNEEGVLQVIQQGVGPPGIINQQNRLLELDIRAWSTDILITEIIVTRIGSGTDNDVSEIRLEDENGNTFGPGTLSDGVVTFRPNIILNSGESRDMFIEVDIHPNAVAENTIGFRIENNHDIITDVGTVSISQEKPPPTNNECSYINNIPDNVSIDGAFADWFGRNIHNDFWQDVSRDDLDILSYGVSSSNEGPSFFLSVNGNILHGEEVPHRNDISAVDVNLDDFSPKTGEDVIYVFIDTINSSGYNADLPIQADYMIEIRGRYNQVTTNRFHEWNGNNPNDWSWMELGSVQVGLDTDQLEVNVGWDDIGVDPENDHFDVFFMVSDSRDETMDHSDGILVEPGR